MVFLDVELNLWTHLTFIWTAYVHVWVKLISIQNNNFNSTDKDLYDVKVSLTKTTCTINNKKKIDFYRMVPKGSSYDYK